MQWPKTVISAGLIKVMRGLMEEVEPIFELLSRNKRRWLHD